MYLGNFLFIFFYIPRCSRWAFLSFIFLRITIVSLLFMVLFGLGSLFSGNKKQENNKKKEVLLNRLILTNKPIASINLRKTGFLTGETFNKQLKNLEMVTNSKLSSIERIKLRDRIIDRIIVLQAAERAKIKPNNGDILEILRSQVGNSNATQEEIKVLYESSEMAKIQTWGNFLEKLKSESILQNYLKRKVLFDSIAHPSDEEIRKFYFEHKEEYIVPVVVRVSHVFFSFDGVGNSKEKSSVKIRAEKALREFGSGKYTFEELVRIYSEHQESAIRLGDLGYLSDAPSFRHILGDEFVTAIMNMRSGQTSGIIKSKEGYHIIKITEKQDEKRLNLSDASPGDPRSTIYQYVERQILNIEYQKKVVDFVNKLRSQAKIIINEDVWKSFLTN